MSAALVGHGHIDGHGPGGLAASGMLRFVTVRRAGISGAGATVFHHLSGAIWCIPAGPIPATTRTGPGVFRQGPPTRDRATAKPPRAAGRVSRAGGAVFHPMQVGKQVRTYPTTTSGRRTDGASPGPKAAQGPSQADRLDGVVSDRGTNSRTPRRAGCSSARPRRSPGALPRPPR
jgi:hypothetical protein